MGTFPWTETGINGGIGGWKPGQPGAGGGCARDNDGGAPITPLGAGGGAVRYLIWPGSTTGLPTATGSLSRTAMNNAEQTMTNADPMKIRHGCASNSPATKRHRSFTS